MQGRYVFVFDYLTFPAWIPKKTRFIFNYVVCPSVLFHEHGGLLLGFSKPEGQVEVAIYYVLTARMKIGIEKCKQLNSMPHTLHC